MKVVGPDNIASAPPDFEIQRVMPERVQPWLLEVYNLVIHKPPPEFSTDVQSIIARGFKYTMKFAEKLWEFRE
ncbi:MAG: hypothetical protein V2I33_24915 [Kangiellaceae bacterium]|jgi:hypothetical protein|nr:hypothetical protein [Kangiellaceae bacterium]